MDSAVLDPESRRTFSCPVCGADDVRMLQLPIHYFRELDRNQHVYSIFMGETLNIEHYSCERCGASDRDRLYALYFRKALSSGATRPLAVLDIAPAPALTRFLKDDPRLQVRTADLYMEGVDDRIDLTNMFQYVDAQFDVFVCSHVLEHVTDDIAAMKELYRVLRPGGWGIAMVPINLGVAHIHEDPTVTDAGSRWKYFGQHDHVRMYSKDGFIERLTAVGFSVDQVGLSRFGGDVFDRHGIHPRSVLYIVTK